MGFEGKQIEQGLDAQQLMLCGKPLDLNEVLQNGVEVTQIRGVRLESPMRMVTFEDRPGSKIGYSVYVSRSAVFIAPIGIDPREAYLDPRSPLMFTAYTPRKGDNVVFTARTRHADDTYDTRLPRGRALMLEAMRFLDSTHMDSSGQSTIRTMEAEFLEPGYTSAGINPRVASDNYTQFMSALDSYKATAQRHLPQAVLELVYRRIAAQTWATKHGAEPLGFTQVIDAVVIPPTSPSAPRRVAVMYQRPNDFAGIGVNTSQV